ncbi:MAG: hypothetical protein KA748_11245 [Halomonas sp.]|nr:hypothetical protein [Halomonas sp.]MBP5980771.1 hypothetical protein [Halomonas sp.]
MKALARLNTRLNQSCQHLVSIIGAGVLLAALLSGSAVGDQHWEALHGEVRRGDVVSLESILDWLDAHYMGEVLEVEVEREKGAVEYEIKMLGPQNQVVEFEFDGHSGQLMSIEGVRINEMRRP